MLTHTMTLTLWGFNSLQVHTQVHVHVHTHFNLQIVHKGMLHKMVNLSSCNFMLALLDYKKLLYSGYCASKVFYSLFQNSIPLIL